MPGESDRPHRTGTFWMDIAVALAALCVSAASFWVALRTDRTQERLLASSVWPALQFQSSDYVETSDPARVRQVIRISVTNAGVGPASIQWFDAYYRGKPFDSATSFLRLCCEHGKNAQLVQVRISNYMQGRILAARESTHFIEVPRNSKNSGEFSVLDRERTHVYVRACYCSVLNECWVFDSRHTRPDATGNDCPRPDKPLFQG